MYCRKAVEDLDEDGNGQVSIHDFETVLQRMNIHLEEFELCKLLAELDTLHSGAINFEQVLEIYQKKRQAEIYGESDQVTLDAYTAIGGPADKSGHIDGEVLVRIIKQEFELPIDIEELIRSVDDSGNGEIEYEEFENMLQDKHTFHIR